MAREVWADIPGTAGLYQASSLGRIRSFNGSHAGGTYTRQERRRKKPIILKDKAHHGGYRAVKVTLADGTRKSMLVHRAVLLAHLGPPDDRAWTGSHANGDPACNRLDNLGWESLSMNKRRQRPAGARITPSNAKLSHDDVRAIRQRRTEGARVIDLAAEYGVKPMAISRLLHHRTFAHVQ